ncbi:hypothetical protein [Candidatus Amarolinea dominans]|uniref:hypothetical protein n=1 Tax=Candidatus Amarolinea dominans TaxID=3140696 RepID=UPI003134C09E|nr:hypothetical protein [Anaerolineae bacterium]
MSAAIARWPGAVKSDRASTASASAVAAQPGPGRQDSLQAPCRPRGAAVSRRTRCVNASDGGGSAPPGRSTDAR